MHCSRQDIAIFQDIVQECRIDNIKLINKLKSSVQNKRRKSVQSLNLISLSYVVQCIFCDSTISYKVDK